MTLKKVLFFVFINIVFQPLLFGGQNSNTLKSKEYFMDTSRLAKIEDFKKILNNKTPLNYDYGRVFRLPAHKTICGRLYSREDGSKKLKLVDYKYIVLKSFSFVDGSFTCAYHTKDEKIFTVSGKIDYWKNLIDGNSHSTDAFQYFNKKYSPNDVEDLYNVKKLHSIRNKRSSTNTFDVFNFSKKIGLYTGSSPKFNNNTITFSEFVSNLITLNSDYVTGVNSFGEIEINPKIEKKLTFVNNEHSQETAIGKTLDWFGSLFSSSATNETKEIVFENIKSFSAIDYFDKKLFGLYYNFMNIAWGGIFQYAGTLFLMFLSLYAGGNLALRYGLHKMKHEDSRGEFEFPIKQRLVAIAMTLMITFVPFPTGTGSDIGASSSADSIKAETTIAKKLISYMSEIGTKIADYSTGNIMTVYMSYMLSASDSYNIKNTKKSAIELSKKLREQKLRTAFFKTVCVDGYPNMHRSFYEMAGVDYDAEWQPSKNLASKQSVFSGTDAEIKDSRPTLNYCANVEKEIAIANQSMKSLKNNIETSIGHIEEKTGNDSTMNANFFAITQLTSAKRLGWFAIATLPILHVYLKNTNLINVGGKIKSSGDSDGMQKAILNSASAEAQSNGNTDIANAGRNITNDNSLFSKLGGGIQYILAKQVYFMMPMFGEVFNASKAIAFNAVDTVTAIMPSSKMISFLKKSLDIATSNSTSKKPLVLSSAVALLGFVLAILLYNLMIKIVFSAVVSLLIVVKIVFYILDVFMYYFVSPFVVGWQMTISNSTDRLHKYISNGFVLLVIKPSLIVFSVMMFIIGLELMRSIYFMLFDAVFSSIEIANKIVGGIVKEDNFGITGLLISSNIKGIGEVFVDLVAMILAYKLIMDGDKMILDKFGYKDETESSIGGQVSEKIQQVVGKI